VLSKTESKKSLSHLIGYMWFTNGFGGFQGRKHCGRDLQNETTARDELLGCDSADLVHTLMQHNIM
jgi:hypothetical protein